MAASTYGEGTLPNGVRSRMIHGVNGLDVHILEAGYESPGRPLALLLHGFPDLAYGWRHLMPILADAGYHVVGMVAVDNAAATAQLLGGISGGDKG